MTIEKEEGRTEEWNCAPVVWFHVRDSSLIHVLRCRRAYRARLFTREQVAADDARRCAKVNGRSAAGLIQSCGYALFTQRKRAG